MEGKSMDMKDKKEHLKYRFAGQRIDNKEWVEGWYLMDKNGKHLIVEYANFSSHTFSTYEVDGDTLKPLFVASQLLDNWKQLRCSVVPK